MSATIYRLKITGNYQMHSYSSSYKLKRFEDSSDPNFAEALLLYIRNTALNIRTDSNEITHWIDLFSKKFGIPFYAFGFYRDRQLVGYAQAAYFHETGLIALDYISIDEPYRRNNVFYEFAEHLKLFFEGAHPEYRYAVAEVCYGPDEASPSRESVLLTRLLKLQGFRVVRAPYYQPRLGDDNAESEVRADILIYSPTYLDKVRRETFLSIVGTLYYKYYLPWKGIYPGSVSQYKIHLDQLYSKIESAISKKQVITVNGHQEILAAPSQKPAPSLHKSVAFSLQALGVIILMTTAMLILRSVFNLSNTSFALVYVLAAVSFIAVAGVVSKNARMVLNEIVTLARYFFDRKKGNSKQSETKKEHIGPSNPNAQ